MTGVDRQWAEQGLRHPRADRPQPRSSHVDPAAAQVLSLQRTAGNAAVTALLTASRIPVQRIPVEMSPEQRARVQQARAFFRNLTETKPPAEGGRPAQAYAQAPPEIVGVMPDEGPARPDHAYAGPEAMPSAERPGPAYSQPELDGAGRPAYSYVAAEGPEGVARPAYSQPHLDASPDAQPAVATEPAAAQPAIAPGPAAAPLSAEEAKRQRARDNWAKLGKAVRTVTGGPARVLPGREGKVKLLSNESPFIPGQPGVLKPRMNVTASTTGNTTWANYWLEALDPQHRPGFILAKRWEDWYRSGAQESFWAWLGDRAYDTNDAVEARLAKDNRRVTYLNEEEGDRPDDPDNPDGPKEMASRPYMILVEDGRLVQRGFKANGRSRIDHDQFSTKYHETVHSGQGWAIFVVSAAGVWYGASHEEGEFHHSSFLSGAAVKAAGEFKVKKGKVQEISGKSGHYRPLSAQLVWALGQLHMRGADLSETTALDYERDERGQVVKDSTGRPVVKRIPALQMLGLRAADAVAPPAEQVVAPAAPEAKSDSGPQPGGPVASLPESRRAELLEKAKGLGWVEEAGQWTDTATGRAYVAEETLLEEMLESG